MANNYPRGKGYTFFIGGALVMMSMTLSSYGIATVTPGLLTSFGAMQHYTLTSLMASIGMLLFLPIAGKLVDTIGRKPLLLFGGAVTLVSSVAAAFAPSFGIFLVLRALITVGTAFLTPIPSATLPFIFDRQELPKLYGFQAAFLALGTFLGSTIAGWCGDMGMTWLAVAYPGVLAAVGALMMFVLCPAIDRKPLPSIDVGGIVLLFLIVAPIMYAASFGPRSGWGSPALLACYVILAVAFALFLRVEKRAASPLINLALFKNPVFTGTLMITFLLVWYQSSMRVYIPLAVQNVMGHSAAASGMVSLPRSILNVVFPTFCGAWAAKNQKGRCWQGLFFAGILIAVGNAMLCMVSANSSLLLIYVGLGLTGIAESFKGATQTPALQSAVSREELGSAMSLNSMMGSMGSAIASAVFGAVHTSICPDTTALEALERANRATFLGSAVSGLIVCVLAFVFVRRMAKTDAAA